MITYETRHDSHEKVNKEKRYMQIKDILGDNEMTAREVATELYKRGFTTSTDRNNAAPRLTELVDKCEVEIAGKKFDEQTGRNVATYKIIAKQLSMFAV
jgi:hypothetical protein